MTDFGKLRTALAACRRDGLPVPLWWRDDDAVAATPALDRLTELSENLGLDVHLAVIPGSAEDSLVEHLAGKACLVPVVHGWRHANHSPPGVKKAEFGAPRNDARVEIATGLSRMRSLFGSRVLPLFVPPWNRMDQRFFPMLAAAGYRGVSTFAPRPDRLAAPGLVRINTHIDPIDWHGSRDLRDPDLLVAGIADILDQRRLGATDGAEPLGYLTHHLVHSPRVWEFSRQVVAELLDGGAAPQPLAPLLETPDEQT